jgi:predicted permease
MLWDDLRHAIRMFQRSRGLVAAAIVSLAIGIGANTAIFSIVDRLMFATLPVHDPAWLVVLRGAPAVNVTYGLFERLRDDASAAAAVAAIVHSDRYNVAAPTNSASDSDEASTRLAMVSGSYFTMLGVTPANGRLLNANDDAPGARRVVVLSDSYWQSRFQGSLAVLGTTLTFGGDAYEIVGVTRSGFSGEWVGRPTDAWIAIVHQPRVMIELPVGGLKNVGVVVMGRLRPNIAAGQAAAAYTTVLQRVLAESAADGVGLRVIDNAVQRIDVEDASRGYSPQRASFGQALIMLTIAVGLVLAVACANLANLLLARSEARQREFAIRAAIGASRSRIVRQLLTESLLLSTVGGALALVLARWATSALSVFMRSGPVGNAVPLSMDLRVGVDVRFLAINAALCVLTGVCVGLVPAFRSSKTTVTHSLARRGADTSSGGRWRFGRLLVVSQVAVSLILLVGSGLFLRTLSNLSGHDLGFDRDHLLLIWALPGQTGGRGATAADYWQRLRERLAAIPGISSVAASNQGVLNGTDFSNLPSAGPGLKIDGRQVPGQLGIRSFVTPTFFQTMGIAIVAGRDFTEGDTAAAPRVVIISQTMAQFYFGNTNPVGRRVSFPEDGAGSTEIIGVSHDFTAGSPREVLRRPMQTYFSYRDKEAERRLRGMTLAVRTGGDPRAAAPALRRELHAADPNLPVLKVDTVDEQLNDVLMQDRLITTLSTFFGALSLLLACVGLYGVISFTVARRTSEIGIRLALGATRERVVWTVMSESWGLLAMGIAIGVLATLFLSRLVAARLFGVTPTDAFTIGTAALLLAAFASAAALVPARRAASIDPLVALRAD